MVSLADSFWQVRPCHPCSPTGWTRGEGGGASHAVRSFHTHAPDCGDQGESVRHRQGLMGSKVSCFTDEVARIWKIRGNMWPLILTSEVRCPEH